MKRLTPTQQRAQLKHVVLDLERAANLLIAVKNGQDTDLGTIAEGYQRNLLGLAQSLKSIHDNTERAMEGRDG
ncbi:MAG TPA: hypothetical protein VFL82_03455 [Thermomicrobiales bacterium]|nr:hypothetical protein [Thermomicrobiales bacterium]